ncbi:NADH-ubiquinone oxidoreductase 9.5 kDa subunit [Paramyrothecium foliicola]|nr:NADH-ubiquinone oxidoreductase 9.5 kDa subunit [Paramyrothecium foliicola]
MQAAPFFWSTPLKYCRWAARERPALFWSVIIGAAGPIAMPIVPPIRQYFGDINPAPVPVTYPGMPPLRLAATADMTNSEQCPPVPGNN